MPGLSGKNILRTHNENKLNEHLNVDPPNETEVSRRSGFRETLSPGTEVCGAQS